ncbi:hypothetical protein [uncultured Campylobacter sp.]|uniref:hypothetical protein n=1 Tax=uncultured Campylobacter sp. TaxID=218934 RepID=UPI002606D268|nr:hypothetical protein [uncultured Campylobacter sp.]
MSASCSTFKSYILSAVHSANAKNRESSENVKHAVACSLSKICSISPLWLNFTFSLSLSLS